MGGQPSNDEGPNRDAWLQQSKTRCKLAVFGFSNSDSSSCSNSSVDKTNWFLKPTGQRGSADIILYNQLYFIEMDNRTLNLYSDSSFESHAGLPSLSLRLFFYASRFPLTLLFGSVR